MSTDLKGGCHCGAVTYTVSAEPIAVRQCQCRNCQKFTGSGHATNAVVTRSAFSVNGPLSAYSYIADSGNRLTRYSCPTCCSPIYGEPSTTSEAVIIRIGTLEDPNALTPQSIIYTQSALKWDKTDPSLPTFPKMP